MLVMKLCDYLGIDAVPVLFEEMYEDARYYDVLNYIAINKKFIRNELEIRKSIIHEVKHLHQKFCVSHKNKGNRFTTIHLITKYILKKRFNYDYHHYDPIYDEILNILSKKYFKE